MRRKSTRNAAKATPEKTEKAEPSPKTRRSKRRKRSPSKSSESEDEPLAVTKRGEPAATPDTTTKSHSPSDDESEEPMWKVTSSEDSAPKGEIQKLKICLTRPSPDSPDKGRSRRSKSGSQTEDDATSSEDKSSTTKRRTRSSRGSPVVKNDVSSQEGDEEAEEKKGKGKSKGKHKSKIDQSPHISEPEIQTNSEISENVQVTPQSPSIDKPVDNENDYKVDDDDINVNESAAEQGSDGRDSAIVSDNNRNSQIVVVSPQTVRNDDESDDEPLSVIQKQQHETGEEVANDDSQTTEDTRVTNSVREETNENVQKNAPQEASEVVDKHDANLEMSNTIQHSSPEAEEIVKQDANSETSNTVQHSSPEVEEIVKQDANSETSNTVQHSSPEVEEIIKQDANLKTSNPVQHSSPEVEVMQVETEEETTTETEQNSAMETEEIIADEANIDNSTKEEVPGPETEVNLAEDSTTDEPKIILTEDNTTNEPKSLLETDTEVQTTHSGDSPKEESKATPSDDSSREETKEEKQTKERTEPRSRIRLNRNTEPAKPSKDPECRPKRKWAVGRDLTSLVMVDLEGVQSVWSSVDFPEEPDLNLEVERERKRSVTETSSKKRERKVSVEYKSDGEKPSFEKQISVGSVAETAEDNSNIIAFNRKISIVDDTASKLKPPPSPAKNPVSNVLHITNLVRPFTVKQLKDLLERTGKIREEEGFWTDRIKSKCYVQYETAEEAEATRNALHGVQWPIGNGKNLIIDYATVEDLKNAKDPPAPPPAAPPDAKTVLKENLEPLQDKLRIEEKLPKEVEKKRSEGPVREWDIGKKDVRRERSRSRERRKKHKRSPSPSDDFISRKQRKAEEAVPQKLMDDLFLKTKATPSIYWQPLSPEEISMKQQQRLIRMEEHKRRMEENLRMKGRDAGRGAFRRRYD